MQICDYNAEEVELLTYREQNFMLLSKFGSKAPMKILRNLSLSQRRGPLIDGLGLTEAGVKVFEDVGWNER